jgi:hypothetical protein
LYLSVGDADLVPEITGGGFGEGTDGGIGDFVGARPDDPPFTAVSDSLLMYIFGNNGLRLDNCH